MADDGLYPFYPNPAPGEIPYSVHSRYIERVGLPSKKALDIFTASGRKNTKPHLFVFPKNLRTLSSSLPKEHPWSNIETFFMNNTILPYLTYFNSSKNVCSQQMDSPEIVIDNATRNLFYKDFWEHMRYPRFCLTCIEEDSSKEGFPYFHREHQLPGVAVCWLHGEILYNGCKVCGPYPITKSNSHLPGQCLCKDGIKPLPAFPHIPSNFEGLRWIARESAYMVSSSGIRGCFSREDLRRLSNNIMRFNHLPDLVLFLYNLVKSRFGWGFLKWLRFQGFYAYESSKAYYNIAYRKEVDSTFHMLLIVGALFGSIQEFELLAQKSSSLDKLIKAERTRTFSKKDSSSINYHELFNHYYRECFTPLNRLDKTPKKKLIFNMMNNAVLTGKNAPMPFYIRRALGDAKIKAISEDLTKGHKKKRICKKHNCPKWVILIIEMTDIVYFRKDSHQNINRKQELKRKQFIDYISSHPSIPYEEAMKALPDICSEFEREDPLWLINTLICLKCACDMDGILDRNKLYSSE